MKKFGVWFLAGSFALSGCATSRPAEQVATAPVESKAAPAAPAATKLDADTSLSLKTSGATFTAPGGWQHTALPAAHLLVDPEGELSVLISELAAENASAALAAAWKQVKPDFARGIRRTINAPPSEGWDEIVQHDYETTTEEGRVVIGLARRRGTTWYVSLLDGTSAAFGRRGAQVMNAVMSLKVAGVEEESFAGRRAHPLTGERLKTFDAFIAEALKQSGVPGAAIAVVQDGRVVFEKGYGVRELGGSQPVTPATLFMIGSTTKSLTTLMMARLVEEGRFSWDTPVTKILPSFALGDTETTKKLQMVHTVCACTGMPRQDFEFIFEYANVTPEMRMAAMSSMKPTTGFGETFQYSNSMVAAGGYVAAVAAGGEKSLGNAYDAAMRAKIFEPLGMKSTTLDFKVAERAEHAKPHAQNLRLEYAPMALSDEAGVVPVRPAGGVWSNVQDMARYLQLELANGVLPDGRRFISEEQLLARRKPQVKITDTAAYGLGLFVEESHGLKSIGHGGNNLGYTSEMFFLPEHGVGLVMLMNASGAGSFQHSVKRRLMEVLFDGREEAAQNLAFGLKQRAELTAKAVAEMELAPDAAWLGRLAGRYSNPSLGSVTISVNGAEGIFDAGEWRAKIARKTEKDGTVKVVLSSPPLAGLELIAAESGELVLKTAQQRYEFARVDAPQANAR